MKLILDTDACKKAGRDVDVILYLLSILAGSKITVNTFEKARQQSLLSFERPYDRRFPFPDYVGINNTGRFVAESAMAQSNDVTQPEGRFIHLAKELIPLFPAGSKVSQTGTKHPWRGNPTTIADRLEKFMLKYGDHSDEDIIDATKRYVADYMGKPTMRILMYFIYKNVDGEKKFIDGKLKGDSDRISMLADYLENKEADVPVDFDWNTTLK